MPLVVLLMLTLAGLQRQTGPASSDASQWPRYRDQAHRLSFAYPTDLHPVISPAEELERSGIGGWVSHVWLVGGAGGEGFPILNISVYACDDPKRNPGAVGCWRESAFRKLCDSFEKFPLGDATAIQCVTYGRGACLGSAVVLRANYTVNISAPEAEHEVQPGANDRAACADAVVAIRQQRMLKQVLGSFRFRQAD
jgi:hypothetical protein